MKYTLSINQKVWQKKCPKADIRHAVVLEAIKSLCNSKSDKIIRTNDGFTWVASKTILDELPMLKIKTKAGISPIIKSLQDWKFIEIRRDKISGYQYYKLTEKSESLERDISKYKDNLNLHPYDPLNDPVKTIEHPRKEDRTYKSTKDPYTNNQEEKTFGNEKEQFVTETPFDRD